MYDYQAQLPNFNVSQYTPRSVRPGMLNKIEDIQVDVSNMKHVSIDTPQMAIAIWISARINTTDGNDGVEFLGDTPSVFTHACNVQGRSTIYQIVTYLNEIAAPYRWRYHLQRVGTWENVQLALLEGMTVMAGGSVYSSFEKALKSGVVPMPMPGEDLLGGQIVNIVGFNRKKDMAQVIGNMGVTVGKEGLFEYRGSHLRNLGIFRDYFILTPRYTHVS